tara:strand:+ start:292 stop:1026 length:735 start_codon:yes stop_codon:yes gene_type:complete
MIKKVIFKNITFNNINVDDFDYLIKQKKLFLFPSGSGIPLINKNKNYYLSLKKADFVFFDSGFFVILLRLFKNISVSKFSGFKFLNIFFKYLKKNKKTKIFCIDPNFLFSKSNKNYLKKIGVKNIYNYIAPKYNPKHINDKLLVKKINHFRPDFILTNIGGGTQEILAMYLKKNIRTKSSILCTGGAISFFTGNQAPINSFIDKIYLGWLLRLIFNPFVFIKRYIFALKLFPMVLFNKVKVIYD